MSFLILYYSIAIGHDVLSIVNTRGMDADHLALLITRASAAMILISVSQNFSISTPERLNFNALKYERSGSSGLGANFLKK